MRAFIKSSRTNSLNVTRWVGFYEELRASTTFEVEFYGKKNFTMTIEVNNGDTLSNVLNGLFKEEIEWLNFIGE